MFLKKRDILFKSSAFLLFLALCLFALLNYKFHFLQSGRDYKKDASIIVGDIRVQLLSDTLCRIEKRGAKGFEDRNTFTVVNRGWSGTAYKIEKQPGSSIITTKSYKIIVQGVGESLKGLRIESKNGELLYEYLDQMVPLKSFPNPGDNERIWLMPDTPRIIPPDWGATPAPKVFEHDENSGWDINNSAPDFYAFIPGQGGVEQLRHDFLKLTGRIPLPPIYAFGLWNSRYYPYTEETALSAIRSFREKNIPLDVLVLDTDWRAGGSKGYEINEKLFPDMKRFLDRVHNERVFSVFNDHPEAITEKALNSKEFQFRYDNLTSILSLGVDAWWYDRNWQTQLKEPAAGINKEIWGMRLYHDITQKYRPKDRPLVLSNVDGINHGVWHHPTHPASHRYPIWWTGDTYPTWEYLQRGIANGVNSGLLSMLPYVSEDLGGHYGQPTNEFYIRSLQYGAFSPIMRLHSSAATRYPWDFGAEIEEIAGHYIKLRYRLFPLLYSAARQAYDDGVPILRRCDLYWPGFVEAKSDQQYLFGEDLLIAPMNDVKGFHPIPDALLRLENGSPGLTGEYFDNMELKGNPSLVRVDRNIHFDWGEGKGSSPAEGLPEDHFSVRWQANLGPVTASGQYEFSIMADDGVRMWIDDQLVVDSWGEQVASSQTGKITLEKDRIYRLRLEYFDNAFKASCRLAWWNLDDNSIPARMVWIPPGKWQDVWTGAVITGPTAVEVSSELWHMPLFVRQGGVILSIPQVQSTRDNLWSTIVVDAFMPENDGTTTRVLYEDDGISTSYQHGAYSKTPVTLKRKGNHASLEIGKRAGEFTERPQQRTWVVRVHFSKGEVVQHVTLNGKMLFAEGEFKNDHRVALRFLKPMEKEGHQIFMGSGERPAMNEGAVLEIKISDSNVQEKMKFAVVMANEE